MAFPRHITLSQPVYIILILERGLGNIVEGQMIPETETKSNSSPWLVEELAAGPQHLCSFCSLS